MFVVTMLTSRTGLHRGKEMVKILNRFWWNEEITRNRKYTWRMTEEEKRGISVVEMDALRSCGIPVEETVPEMK